MANILLGICIPLLMVLGVTYSLDPLMDSPAADDLGGLTIDQVINNAAMKGHINVFASLAKNPENIDTYVMSSDPREGTVRIDNDMLFTAEQWANIKFVDDNKTRKKRKAIKHEQYRWPNNVVSYSIARGVFSGTDIGLINGAIGEWQRETCLVFKTAASSERNKIVFQNGGGCSSYVGRIGGNQPLTLAPGCRHHGIIVHEMGHAIGFQHEQTRPDRDDYVTIHESNIQPSTLFNFKRYSWDSVASHGVPYDYLSIMHYGTHAFSQNGQQTISVKDSRYKGKIGNRKGLSFRDIKLANVIYKCAERNQCPRKKCPGEGFVDKNCNCKCPGNPIKSCASTGTLGTTSATQATVSPSRKTVKPTGSCQDISSNCVHWAVGDGCKHHYPSMSKMCRKTCKLCTVSRCLDKNRHCPSWKTAGYCTSTKYKTYMVLNCPVSCSTCPSSDLTDGKATCEDTTPFCKVWSIRGDCESNPIEMKKLCGYTCNFCG